MNTYTLTVSSPDGTRFQDEVMELSLRGAGGDLAVLAGHIPFMTSVQPGKCKVVLVDGTERIGIVDGGLLTVSKDGATLLSGSFRWDAE